MTPGQLIKAVSIALDVPEETVFQHDRNLAVDGLRTKGGRGPSAPDVTPLDAARLLVAILGSIRVKDSVDTVRAFEKTKHTLEGPWYSAADQKKIAPNGKTFPDEAITALPADHSFVQALESLITSASAPFNNLDAYLRRFALVTIECGVPIIQGRIGRVGNRCESLYAIPKPKKRYTAGPEIWRIFANRVGVAQRRSATGTAIMLLGKAFRDNGLPFEKTREALAALDVPTQVEKG
jgi:hypothetical protein